MNKVNFVMEFTDEDFEGAAKQAIKSKVREIVNNEINDSVKKEIDEAVKRVVKNTMYELQYQYNIKELSKLLEDKTNMEMFKVELTKKLNEVEKQFSSKAAKFYEEYVNQVNDFMNNRAQEKIEKTVDNLVAQSIVKSLMGGKRDE